MSEVTEATVLAPIGGEVVEVKQGVQTISMSDETLKSLENSGVVVGEIGTKISRVPIEKYKASTQKIDRIGFVTRQVIGVKSHYIDDVGSILCFGKKCCEIAGMPSVRYLFPVIVYSTDNEGNIAGKKVDLKILSAGEDLYKSICTISKGLAATMGGIDNADLLVTCTDDKYQKITLSPISAASWRASQSIVQMVTERWAQDSEFAYMALARKVDEAAFLKIMGMDDAGHMTSSPAGASGNSFNAAANQDLTKFFDD